MILKTISNPSLLVIDCQKVFFNKGMRTYLETSKLALPNILLLIDHFRNKKLPIVFTRHAHEKGKPTGQMGKWWNNNLPYEGEEESMLVDEINVSKNDIILTKSVYSAFEQSRLDTILHKIGVTNIVICGAMTNLCVETTARHAFMKDFQPIVVSDATATKNLAYHKASLLNLSYGFAYVEKTKNIIKKI